MNFVPVVKTVAVRSLDELSGAPDWALWRLRLALWGEADGEAVFVGGQLDEAGVDAFEDGVDSCVERHRAENFAAERRFGEPAGGEALDEPRNVVIRHGRRLLPEVSRAVAMSLPRPFGRRP